MNSTNTCQKRLRQTITCAALAAAAAWSCFSLVENRHQAWAQDLQQRPAFYPASHQGPVENFFAGLR